MSEASQRLSEAEDKREDKASTEEMEASEQILLPIKD
jgi:hypothetical protein